ncbi:DgyrCDS1188 [Dimorphilus gyrociliatus]|uniref:Small ribosomal subunit protein uS2m n=1 Tax=Dimorphilus gyrociliatus TaxID=2664684 RepID=A0A7I8V6U1_9ANNE|nr:DgyrCDS1188 [Dimorphilus gyrociliatus]
MNISGMLSMLLLSILYYLMFGANAQEQLQPDATYMILAPRKVYPNEVVQVQVSIFKMYGKSITVRGNIRKNGAQEFARFKEVFEEEGTRLVQMKMPTNADMGNYTMRIEAFNEAYYGAGYVFENETDLIFDVKQVSVFIQTNKPIYRQGQTVHFRIIPVKPNLLPVHGSMDIYMLDNTGMPIRRWLDQQTNAGILDMKMQLSAQPRYGVWKIKTVFEGATYEKEFQVEEYYPPRFFVNVSMPLYLMDDSFALAGLITVNHTSGRPAKGQGKVRLEIRDPKTKLVDGKEYKWDYIEKPIFYFNGRSDFIFFMDEIRAKVGNIANKELHVIATIYDWHLTLTSIGYGVCVIYENKVKLKLLGDKSRTFKPGFPVNVYYAVIDADGRPLYGNRRQVTVQRSVNNGIKTTALEEEKLVVRDDGIVSYTFIAESDARFITLQAYYDLQGFSNQVECIFSKYYTYNNHYIKISTTTERPFVDHYMVFTVRLSTYVNRVYYQIVSGGNIQTANSLEMSSQQKTFSVAISRDMVPSSRIIAYYLYKGEVIVDSLNFFVNGTGMNPVEVRINQGKDFSRDTIEVTGITDPGSFIAFSGIDYDMWSKGGNIFLTESEILRELETYDSHANLSDSHTWYYGEAIYKKMYFPAATYGVDANTTFEYAGIIIFTDAKVSRIQNNCNRTQGFLPCNDGSCFKISERCDNTSQCIDEVDELGCYPNDEPSIFTKELNRFKHLNRHYEEEGSWLWMSHFVKPDGRIDLKTNVPKEPMSWTVGAVSMSREKGLGILEMPARHQSTRPFYIQVEGPVNIIRGEQIGLRVALFNYWSEDLECLVTVHDSDDYRIVLVEDYGYVNSYNPRTTRGDIQTMIYLRASDMYTIHFPISPIKGGNVTVYVTATSFMGKDTVSHTFNIKYDGTTNYYHTPLLIDLINTGSDIIPDLWIIVPDRFFTPEQQYHNFVPGSAKAFVSVSGDIIGTGFFKPFLNAMNMMRKPFGAAEQNAFNIAVNIYYLRYLKETNQLRKEVLKDALTGVNIALQRQFSYYMRDIGAFTMFRDYENRTPSLWLTAFVLQTLNFADLADWRLHIYIPPELINKLGNWAAKQQQTDGSFVDPSPPYDKRMSNHTDNISLTAYVLIALNDAEGISGSERNNVEQAKRKARSYLERNYDTVKHGNDSFKLCIVCYALAQSESSMRFECLSQLEATKKTSIGIYWSDHIIPSNPFKIVATIIYQNPRNIYPTESTAVAATSYALKTFLKLNQKIRPQEIMKWMQTMRNTIGGFIGTQDTAIALQALTDLSKKDTNRHLYKMLVTLQSTSSEYWTKEVYLNNSNYVDTHTLEIPKVWGSVRARAQGTGVALIQLETQMNVEFGFQQFPRPNQSFFQIELENLRLYGKNFSIFEADVCGTWTRPDISKKTGLVLMEVDLPTGYIIMNDLLRSYVQSHTVKNLARAEYLDKKVVFYIDSLEANVPTCVRFTANRWFPVANVTIQHSLHIYDYYEPGMFNLSMYKTNSLFGLHICQVCGSFQCPYCPDYNTATDTASNINVIETYIIGQKVLSDREAFDLHLRKTITACLHHIIPYHYKTKFHVQFVTSIEFPREDIDPFIIKEDFRGGSKTKKLDAIVIPEILASHLEACNKLQEKVNHQSEDKKVNTVEKESIESDKEKKSNKPDGDSLCYNCSNSNKNRTDELQKVNKHDRENKMDNYYSLQDHVVSEIEQELKDTYKHTRICGTFYSKAINRISDHFEEDHYMYSIESKLKCLLNIVEIFDRQNLIVNTRKLNNIKSTVGQIRRESKYCSAWKNLSQIIKETNIKLKSKVSVETQTVTFESRYEKNSFHTETNNRREMFRQQSTSKDGSSEICQNYNSNNKNMFNSHGRYNHRKRYHNSYDSGYKKPTSNFQYHRDHPYTTEQTGRNYKYWNSSKNPHDFSNEASEFIPNRNKSAIDSREIRQSSHSPIYPPMYRTQFNVYRTNSSLATDTNVKKSINPLEEEDFFKVRDMVTLNDLFENRIHLGHKKGVRNQYMTPYIYGNRLQCDIIDLDQTLPLLHSALNFTAHIASRGGVILFVSRHRETTPLVQKTAQECGEYAHCHYWSGGLFTNSTVLFGTTIRLPDLLIFPYTHNSIMERHVAIKEAAKLNIPTVGIVDTNSDPRLITYPVPGNDDSKDSIQLYLRLFKEAIMKGKEHFNMQQ